jgi:hypothetical protein
MLKKNNLTKSKKIFIGVLLSLVIIGGIAASSAVYLFLPWKNVYVTAKGTKVYEYSMSNEMVEQADALNAPYTAFVSEDPTSIATTQLVTSNARNEVIYKRLFYIMGLKDGFTATQDEINTAIDAFKKKANQGTNESVEQSYKDELSVRSLTEKEFAEIVKENIISQKEEAKLTASITLSDKELKAYIDEWGFGYDSKNPNRQEVYEKNIEQIKKDALNMKKEDYITDLEKKLLADSMNEISFDNPYKKFMRWLYGSFLGISIPDQYKPESSM